MIVNDLILPIRYTEKDLWAEIRKKTHQKNLKIGSVEILRRSIDARKKPNLRFVLTVRVNEPKEPFSLPKKQVLKNPSRVIVVGAGPCGLFAALTLQCTGIPVLLLERGEAVEQREASVKTFWETGKLLPDSNVQFGEGGAGTFSDGKLNTLTHNPLNDRVLRTFVHFGAKEEILYDAKPHIGTDALVGIVRNMRKRFLREGGEVRFNAKMSTLLTETEAGKTRVTGVRLENGEEILSDFVVLSIGHSARDTFEMLRDLRVPMEKKPFAVGVRIEHPEPMITEDQYGTLDYEELGAAPYKLTGKAEDGRGVYTFCMCPGGYVVNASSEAEKLCINGMSYAARDSKNSNSALVVQVTPEDFPGDDVLAGVSFQREMEKKAYLAGNGKIPTQILKDFVSGRKTTEFGAFTPEMKGGYAFADLNEVLPKAVAKALKDTIPFFGRKIKGFDREDAILSCVEARTSSPVRILRNEQGESEMNGLFPAGEGAGYAGGILSSAKDGIFIAERILDKMGVHYDGRED